MNAARWKQIDELVDAALDLPENERDAFIAVKTDGDEDLRRAVSELLSAQGETDNFLQHSAMKIVAKAIAADEPAVKPALYLGRTISTYRIEKLLGVGGMGEVYLAFDEKMKRNVALKILPAEFVSNDERVRRFEMEARAISSINHPNIVTIYDVGNFEGINYIATEFVEGKTLRDLIGGTFKLRNVMANSIQICDALSAAHEKGIIHRDIKPENIMIRKDGYAKILDFGVAKLTEVGPQTIGTNTTRGMIIGTPAYMSPAQVSGDGVDHRTDIWSAGVVLYEFITGKNPFKGANRQATFQAILTADPPACSEINHELPEDLDQIFCKILQKDPDRGYQTANDLRADLRRLKRELDTTSSTDEVFASGTVGKARRFRIRPRVVFAAVGFLMGVGLVFGLWTYYSGRREVSRWNDAVAQQLTDFAGMENFPSLSADKKVLLFTRTIDDKTDIYWQRVGGSNPRNLTKESPEDDTHPAFSPDGEHIAFRSERSGGGIFLMGATGESVRRLTAFGYNPAWSRDGKMIAISSVPFTDPTTRSLEGTLSIVDVGSSETRSIETGVDVMQPQFSPNSEMLVFWSKDIKFQRDLWTVSIRTGHVERLTNDDALDWSPVWDPGGRDVYFCSNRNGQTSVWKIAVDPTTGTAAGEPEIVAPLAQSSMMTISADGKDLVLARRIRIENIQATDFDPVKMKITGKPVFLTEGSKRARTPDVSPNGNEVAFYSAGEGQEDIMLLRLDDLKWNHLTNDVARDRVPRFSPDGSQIAFYSNASGFYEIWTVKTDGSERRQITNLGQIGIQYPSWSPDGTRMSYSMINGTSYIFDPTRRWEEQSPFEIPPLNAKNDRFIAWSWSPDGKKISGWRGNEELSSIPEVWTYDIEANSFEKILDNGTRAAWLADSRRLIFTRGSRLFLVDTETRQETELGSVAPQEYDTVRISNDNRRIFYTLASEEGDIQMLSLK